MSLPELADLQQALRGRDDQTAVRRHLVAIANLIQAIVVRGDARLDDHDAQLAAGATRLDTLDQEVSALQATPAITMTIAATAGALPTTAAPTRFFRVQGDPAVYIGNGPGQPLTKLVPA